MAYLMLIYIVMYLWVLYEGQFYIIPSLIVIPLIV